MDLAIPPNTSPDARQPTLLELVLSARADPTVASQGTIATGAWGLVPSKIMGPGSGNTPHERANWQYHYLNQVHALP